VSKFVNVVLIKGKKSTARRIVYDAFDLIQKRANKSPLDVFKQAILIFVYFFFYHVELID